VAAQAHLGRPHRKFAAAQIQRAELHPATVDRLAQSGRDFQPRIVETLRRLDGKRNAILCRFQRDLGAQFTVEEAQAVFAHLAATQRAPPAHRVLNALQPAARGAVRKIGHAKRQRRAAWSMAQDLDLVQQHHQRPIPGLNIQHDPSRYAALR